MPPTGAKGPVLRGLIDQLESSRGPWLLAAMALLLSLPSLVLGLQTDDHMLIAGLEHDAGPFSLFHFDPTFLPDHGRGLPPWWSSPVLQFHFLRPLASLTHWLDFHLWGASALPMHGLNILLYAFMAWAAGALFQTLMEATPARLAGLMFAVNEAHAYSAGWISARNTLLATLFMLLALLTYHRSRNALRGPNSALSVLCVALALASAEAGVGVFAYLIAYSLVLDRGPIHARVRGLAPHLAVFALWLTTYLALGCGVRGSGWYRDFAGQPVDTLLEGLSDLPLWLLSLFGPSVASFSLLAPPVPARLWAALLAVPLLLVMSASVLSTRPGRFFVMSIALGLVPLLTVVPQDRLLIGLSLGGFGALALFVTHASASAGRAVRLVGGFTRVVHLGLAPLLFIPFLNTLAPSEGASRRLAAAWPQGPDSEVVMINLPLTLLATYAYLMREDGDAPPLASMHQLYAGGSALSVKRLDESTLELTVERGWGDTPLERIYADPAHAPAAGNTVDLVSMNAEIMETAANGMPRRVRFHFPNDLEQDNRLWLLWQGTRPVPWHPPAVGTRVQVGALNYFRSM